tara:strand:+ start:633 stop:740 length:108 start_codon:yes stop_codon:yes gene_type:complete
MRKYDFLFDYKKESLCYLGTYSTAFAVLVRDLIFL